MKVAVTAQGRDLASQLEPRFGRASYFVVVDTDSGQFDAHDNTKNIHAVQGAGIQAGRTVVDLGVEAVITGHVGPKAFGALQAGGIKVYQSTSETVQDALDALKTDQLRAVEKANVEGHW